MQVKARVKFIRSAPRKTRLVVDLARGMKAADALDQLRFSKKLAARPILKLLKSAIANAEHNYNLNRENLKIEEIKVDEGPVLKRWMPRAHGRATPLRKKMSHINITLSEIKDSGEVKPKKQKIDAPVELGAEPKKQENNKTTKPTDAKDNKDLANKEEKGKEIVDPRGEGRGGHAKIEGKGGKGFAKNIFRRKSG